MVVGFLWGRKTFLLAECLHKGLRREEVVLDTR